MANREQPSCVDMQTCGQLALSQMPASIKLQMILFRHFSAHLQIVKAVIAMLMYFMGRIAGIGSQMLAERVSSPVLPSGSDLPFVFILLIDTIRTMSLPS